MSQELLTPAAAHAPEVAVTVVPEPDVSGELGDRGEPGESVATAVATSSADRVGETCPEGDYCLWPREGQTVVATPDALQDADTTEALHADGADEVLELPAEAVMEASPAEAVIEASPAEAGMEASPASTGVDDGTVPATLAAGSPPAPPTEPPSGDGGDGTEDDESPTERPMTLLDHLSELRNRLIRVFAGVTVGFLLCYSVAKTIFHYLALPLIHVLPGDSRLMFTGLPGGFFVELKVAFVAGIFLASPYIFYQIWAFIAPGLYANERRYIIPLAVCSALFFLGGASFCYFVVFPFAFAFFVSYASDIIVAMPSINEYLSFSLELLMAFGLIFEMPLFAFFLARMGLITAKRMRAVRRYAVLGVFVVAAIMTPPDVFSQLLMAVPMLVLYELSILVAASVGKKEATPDGEAAA